MLKPPEQTELRPRLAAYLRGVLPNLLLAAAVATLALAQGTAADLRSEIEAAYEVLPITGGVLLKPSSEDASFVSLEISQEGLAINGEPVTEEELRSRLGDGAEAILRLAALAPEELRQTLGLEGRFGSAGEPEAIQEVEAVTLPEAPEVPEAPEPPSRIRIGDKVVFGSSVTIGPDEIAREVVVIGGTLRVEGEVEREVVVIGGSARINGEVGREVTIVGGNLTLGPEARLGRDVTLIGGQLTREPGAEIEGSVNEVAIPGAVFGTDEVREVIHEIQGDLKHHPHPWRYLGDVFWELVQLALLALLVCLVLLLGDKLVERTEWQVATEPWKAAGVGFLAQVLLVFLLPVVILFLVLTIIGIPLLILIPFVLLALVILALVGYAAVAMRLGRLLRDRFGWSFRSPYSTAVAGIVLIQIWGVLAALLDFRFLSMLSILLGVFAFLIEYAAVTIGFGALLLAWMERRRALAAAAAPLPPVPPTRPAMAGEIPETTSEPPPEAPPETSEDEGSAGPETGS